MKYNRFLPLIISIFTQILLEVFVFIPKSIYVVLLIILLLFFFSIRQFVLAGGKKEKIFPLFILPGIFTIGAVVFSTMIANKMVIQILIFFNTSFIYFYFSVSAVYGLNAFLKVSIWILIILLMLVIMAIMYQILWTYKIDLKTGYFYILLVCLVLVEIAWVASFLTLSYYVLGLLLAQCYYILTGIIKLHLRNRLSNRNLKLYLIYGFLSIFLVLLTARWI